MHLLEFLITRISGMSIILTKNNLLGLQEEKIETKGRRNIRIKGFWPFTEPFFTIHCCLCPFSFPVSFFLSLSAPDQLWWKWGNDLSNKLFLLLVDFPVKKNEDTISLADNESVWGHRHMFLVAQPWIYFMS